METRERKKWRTKKPEQDVESALKRKFKRKCQFRAIVRLVYQNIYWLQEDIRETDEVKIRVAKAMQKKEKKLLTIKDKILLNKPAADRTNEEKKYLNRIIGGLKCFNRYPNHVKKKLAAVTYFKYYGPNRVIIREKHPGYALYFIVTGEVKVSHLVYDGLLQQYQSVDLKVLRAGDLFGEIALLHNIPRSATCTTITDCEFLVLLKDDFESILQRTLQATWDEVLNAMSCFSYFDSLDEVSRREGCILAKLKAYNTNDIILGDGHGLTTHVYFVIEGQCQLIQDFKVAVIPGLKRTRYKLYESHEYVMRKGREESILKMFPREPSTKTDLYPSQRHINAINRSKESTFSNQSYAPVINFQDLEKIDAASIKLLHYHSQITSKSGVMFQIAGSPRHVGIKGTPDIPEIIRTVFMQVCLYNPGSTFGLGENMKERRIIALNPVVCLLLPITWLHQHNTANIWTRIKYYLDKNIPNKEKLFEEFKIAMRWKEFKEEIVEDIVARSPSVNWTSIHDVPYSIRLEEMLNV